MLARRLSVSHSQQPIGMCPMVLRSADHVFLSYATPDLGTAATVAAAVKPHVARLFVAPEATRAGESFVGQINDALTTCTAALVVWSASAAQSQWVRDETDALLVARNQRHTRLHLVAIDDTPLPALLRATEALRTTASAAAADVTEQLAGVAFDRGVSSHRVPLQTLDAADAEIIARTMRRVASEFRAATKNAVFTVTTEGGRQLLVDVNTDALEGAMSSLDQTLQMIDILRGRIQFLRQQDQTVMSRAAQRSLADETRQLNPLLQLLVKQCFELGS